MYFDSVFQRGLCESHAGIEYPLFQNNVHFLPSIFGCVVDRFDTFALLSITDPSDRVKNSRDTISVVLKFEKVGEAYAFCGV